jgi:hypothetical protein
VTEIKGLMPFLVETWKSSPESPTGIFWNRLSFTAFNGRFRLCYQYNKPMMSIL